MDAASSRCGAEQVSEVGGEAGVTGQLEAKTALSLVFNGPQVNLAYQREQPSGAERAGKKRHNSSVTSSQPTMLSLERQSYLNSR